jgi:dolichol-phosphate mannosyltransferase
MMNEKVISVILPCFNEKGNIVPLVQEITKILTPYPHEIIVIDDNSPDGTYQAILNLNLVNLKPILRTSDHGFAKSIRAGIEASSGEILIIMDSDYNHEPSYLPLMIENCRYFDVVSGSRFVYGGLMNTRTRHLCSWLFNMFVRIVTRKMITDSLFGYLAIKREALTSINFDDVFWGYGDYCIRLMYYFQENACSILQIPVVIGQRKYGEGNKRLIRTFFQYFKETLRLVIRDKKDLSYVQNIKKM